MQFALPSSSFGYYRGNPIYGGDGSGQGVNMAGSNVFSAGQGAQGSSGSATAWSPTILYMFVLILVEMFVFAIIARKL
jgi:hypothetical protein